MRNYPLLIYDRTVVVRLGDSEEPFPPLDIL